MRIEFPPARRLAACLLVTLCAAGCESETPPGTARQAVEVSALPVGVRQAAEKALPGVALGEAWKNVDVESKALHSYEVRGRAGNGKIREVRVATDGKILEVE